MIDYMIGKQFKHLSRKYKKYALRYIKLQTDSTDRTFGFSGLQEFSTFQNVLGFHRGFPGDFGGFTVFQLGFLGYQGQSEALQSISKRFKEVPGTGI